MAKDTMAKSEQHYPHGEKLRREIGIPLACAQEIVDDLEAALEQMREIAADLRANSVSEQDPEITE